MNRVNKKFISVFILINCLFTFLVQFLSHYSPSSDSLRYVQLAKQYSAFNFFDPVTNCYGHPFYAWFLALIGNVFSYHHFVVGLIQSLIFCFAALLLISQVEKLLKKDLSGIIVVLFLVPEVHFHNGYMITESLTYSLIMTSFYLALRIYNSYATISNMFFLSFILAITVLNRLESSVIIFPILFLIYPRIKDKLASSLLIFFSITFVLLQLNGYRNYRTFNTYKLSAFNGGEVIYGGNNENLDGSHHPFWEYKNIFIPKNKIEGLNKILSQPECTSCPGRDSFFLNLAKESWQKDPVAQLKVIPYKMAKNWLIPGDFDVYTFDTTKTKGLQLNQYFLKENFNNANVAPYKHLVYLLSHWAILLMLVIGIFKLDKHNRFQLSVLILFGLYFLFAIPFCGLPRWHVAIFPIMIIAFAPLSFVERINKMIRYIFKM